MGEDNTRFFVGVLVEAETKCVGLRSVDARKGFCGGGGGKRFRVFAFEDEI